MTRFSECHKCSRVIYQEQISGVWYHDDPNAYPIDHLPMLEWEAEKSDAEIKADQMNTASYDY